MIHSESFKIRFSEIGVDEKIQKYQYCNFFQEAAGRFCYNNQVSGFHLKKLGLGWVIAGYTIEFSEKQPTWNDTITVDTWANSNNGIITTRDFLANDDKGKLLAKASSAWAIIDLKTRKAVSSKTGTKNEWLIDKFNFEKNRPGKIIFPEKLEKLPSYTSKWRPGLISLDINKHVNNVNYISIAMGAIKDELTKNKYLQKFKINYKKEVVFGDLIFIQVYNSEDTFYQKFIRESDQACVATTLLEYREKTK